MFPENPDVADPLDSGSESKGKLPKPELNPMINPTLGRNLGRWAQTYFTSPPEQREQAVVELLRELEGENPGSQSRPCRPTEPPKLPRDDSAPAGEGHSQPNQLPPNIVVCARCQHYNFADQRFCGTCGSPLTSAFLDPEPATRHTSTSSPTSKAPLSSPVSSTAYARQADGMEWLREKHLASFLAANEERHPVRNLVIVVLLLLTIGFIYLQWRAGASQQPPSHVAATVPPAAPRVSTPPSPQEDRLGSSSSTETSSKAEAQSALAPQNPAASEDAGATASSSALQPRPLSTTGQRNATDTGAAAEIDSGTAELSMAEDFLSGHHRARNTREAAKWLWKAVSKQNSAALVVLADLYQRGDGVTKSCDQARLLLVAAAKKGSREAADRLRNLQSSGCR